MFKIITDNDFLYDESLGIVDCTFYLDINGNIFPNKKWTDFATEILVIWGSTLIENHHKYNATFSLIFIDGDYNIECVKEGNNIQMSFMKERGILCFKENIDIQEFFIEFIRASNKLISDVHEKGLDKVTHLDYLKKSLNLLGKLGNT